MKRLEVETIKLFREIMVYPHYSGYQYLLRAVELIYNDKYFSRNITKVLYPALAEEFKEKPESIERCIRHARNQTDQEALIRIFGTSYFTNHSLIMSLVEELRLRLNA